MVVTSAVVLLTAGDAVSVGPELVAVSVVTGFSLDVSVGVCVVPCPVCVVCACVVPCVSDVVSFVVCSEV